MPCFFFLDWNANKSTEICMQIGNNDFSKQKWRSCVVFCSVFYRGFNIYLN